MAHEDAATPHRLDLHLRKVTEVILEVAVDHERVDVDFLQVPSVRVQLPGGINLELKQVGEPTGHFDWNLRRAVPRDGA